MKYTLLDMVQKILSSMDSDEVNSIGDTVESRQVLDIIETVYNDLCSSSNLTSNKDLYELRPSNDINKPTIMYRPDGVTSILWVKYDMREPDEVVPNYQVVTHLPLGEFLGRMHSFASLTDDSNVISFEVDRQGDSLTVSAYNNRHPQFFTSVSDSLLLFDAYRADMEGTLVSDKTLAYGERVRPFLKQDNFTPDLNPKQFTLLFNESKALAFAELKQTSHQKAERKVRQAMINLQREKTAVPLRDPYRKTGPNYGRK